jgi:hypothetical protein
MTFLEDCEKALAPIENEWAVQCRGAVAAMRAGLDGPAQSHASNIIDSIVLGLHGKNGRKRAKERAQEDFDDLPLQLAAENLSLGRSSAASRLGTRTPALTRPTTSRATPPRTPSVILGCSHRSLLWSR